MKKDLPKVIELLALNATRRTVEATPQGKAAIIRLVDGAPMTAIESPVLVKLHELTGGFSLVLKPDGTIRIRPWTEEEKKAHP